MSLEKSALQLIRDCESKGVDFQLDCGSIVFRAPPGKLSSAEIGLLRARKPELIRLLRRRLDLELSGLFPEPVEAVWRTAPVQRYMAADPKVQNSVSSVLWKGPLEQHALRDALAGLLGRHSALRTHFARGPGDELLAVTRETVDAAVENVDLRLVDEGERRIRAGELINRLSWRQFDIYSAPLFSFAAVQLDTELTLFVLAVHHALCDASAADVISGDLETLYRSAVRGKQESMEPLTVEYRDFVRAESEWMSSKEAATHIEYWRDQMRGCQSIFRLPYDQPDTTSGGPCVETSAIIAGSTLTLLRRLAFDERATMFSVFVAALYSVLASWSAEADVSSWVCQFGRPHPALTRVVGCFLNFWLLRIKVDEKLTFAGLVRQVQATYLAAVPHLRVSYDRVIAELQQLNSGEIFPGIMLNFVPYVKAGQSPPQRGSAEQESRMPPQRLSKESPLALIVHAIEGPERLSIAAWHNEGLFADPTIAGLCQNVVAVATAAARDPHTPVVQLAARRYAA